MALNWQELKINQAELENIFEPSLIMGWAIDFCRAILLRQSKYNYSLLVTEISLGFLSLIFCFPLSLIILRKLDLINNNNYGLMIISLVAIFISFLLLLGFNYFLWQQAQKLKIMSNLLEKVTKYNNLIENFQLVANINNLSHKQFITNLNQDINLSSSIAELQNILKLTKNSLLNSIELENLIYCQQKNKQNNLTVYTAERYQLLASLEHNLIDLSVLENDSDQKYQELFKEAIAIGLSVHREMRKIINN